MEKVIILAILAGWVAWADEKRTPVDATVRVETMTPDEVAAQKAAITAMEKAGEDLKALEEKIAVNHKTTTGYKPEAIRSGTQEFIMAPSVYNCNTSFESVEFRGTYLVITSIPNNHCLTLLSH